MVHLTHSQRKLALEYEKCDHAFVSGHPSSLNFRPKKREKEIWGKMRDWVLLGFFFFFSRGTRNIFVIAVQHIQFLASKIAFSLWYGFQKQQPEVLKAFNHQVILWFYHKHWVIWLSNWKPPIDSDWLWREAACSPNSKSKARTWRTPHLQLSLKRHGFTSSHSGVIGGSLHMVWEPRAKHACKGLCGVTEPNMNA